MIGPRITASREPSRSTTRIYTAEVRVGEVTWTCPVEVQQLPSRARGREHPGRACRLGGWPTGDPPAVEESQIVRLVLAQADTDDGMGPHHRLVWGTLQGGEVVKVAPLAQWNLYWCAFFELRLTADSDPALAAWVWWLSQGDKDAMAGAMLLAAHAKRRC